MKRVFQYILGGLAMLSVAVLAAFFSMRLAIHGREVVVPNLAGKSDADAAVEAKKLGLNLSVENRFYSPAVPLNGVLSQSPAAGSRVRRGWQVRVTESLGGQRTPVPDVTGQSERPADLVLRRLSLEVGTLAHLPAPGPAGIVLAQSPPPNAVGLNGPKVALLISDGDVPPASVAFVMPSITGMTLGAANARLATAGLRVASATEPQALVATVVPTDGLVPMAGGGGSGQTPAPVSPADGAGLAAVDSVAVEPVVPAPVSQSAVIVSQSPAAGRKVTRADSIRVTVSSSAVASDGSMVP